MKADWALAHFSKEVILPIRIIKYLLLLSDKICFLFKMMPVEF